MGDILRMGSRVWVEKTTEDRGATWCLDYVADGVKTEATNQGICEIVAHNIVSDAKIFAVRYFSRIFLKVTILADLN